MSPDLRRTAETRESQTVWLFRELHFLELQKQERKPAHRPGLQALLPHRVPRAAARAGWGWLGGGSRPRAPAARSTLLRPLAALLLLLCRCTVRTFSKQPVATWLSTITVIKRGHAVSK